mgnify:CR=1 FL=1
MTEQIENQIIHRWQGGQSQRSIARELGVSRWQVARTVAQHQAARSDDSVTAANSALPPPRGQRRSKLDAFEATIARLLERLGAAAPDETLVVLGDWNEWLPWRGALRLPRAAAPAAAAPAPTPADSDASPPVITLDRLVLQSGVVHYADHANSAPFATTITDLNLTVDNGGNTYLGNVFSGGWSQPGGTGDGG